MSRVSRSGRRRSTSAIACSPLAATSDHLDLVVPLEEPGERRRRRPASPRRGGRRRGRSLDAHRPDQALDRLEQRLLVELLLDDVGVGAGLGPAPAARLVAEGGDDHDRQRAVLARPPESPRAARSRPSPASGRRSGPGRGRRSPRSVAAPRARRGRPRPGSRPPRGCSAEARAPRTGRRRPAPAAARSVRSPSDWSERRRLRRGLRDEVARVEDERDPPVPEDRSTEVARHAREDGAEALDHHLFLAEQPVAGHRERGARATRRRSPAALAAAARPRRPISRPEVGQRRPTSPSSSSEGRLPSDVVSVTATTRPTLVIGRPKGCPPRSKSRTLHQRERQRQQQRHLRAPARLALHLEAAAEALDVPLDRVEADAAAGHLGDPLGSREPGLGEDVGQRAASARRAPGARGETPRPSSATSIATIRPRCSARSSTRPARGLPAASRSCGRLDPVRDRVAQQVDDGLRDAVEDHPVELGLGAADRQLDLLALLRTRGRGSRAERRP